VVATREIPTVSRYSSLLQQKGVFAEIDAQLFTRFAVEVEFVDKVMGGVPQKPEIIESWLRTRITSGDTELRQQMLTTLAELGYEFEPDMDYEQIVSAVKVMAQERNGNTFYRDANGLYLGGYQVKAMLKESTAIMFPWDKGKNKWGATGKTPKTFLAEHVFVDEHKVYLDRTEPDGTHTQIGHVNCPQGPRSTLTYVDYCDAPVIRFTLASLHDEVTVEQWGSILVCGQRQGLGALRSMSHGQFVVTGFERLS